MIPSAAIVRSEERRARARRLRMVANAALPFVAGAFAVVGIGLAFHGAFVLPALADTMPPVASSRQGIAEHTLSVAVLTLFGFGLILCVIAPALVEGWTRLSSKRKPVSSRSDREQMVLNLEGKASIFNTEGASGKQGTSSIELKYEQASFIFRLWRSFNRMMGGESERLSQRMFPIITASSVVIAILGLVFNSFINEFVLKRMSAAMAKIPSTLAYVLLGLVAASILMKMLSDREERMRDQTSEEDEKHFPPSG